MSAPGARPPLALVAALVALVAWGLYPFRVILGHYPWKVDDLKWVTDGASTNPDWVTWVFGSRHFVGYRPLTALSFTIDHALGGWSPEVYRLTDFGLHALAALAVALLFQRLIRGWSWWVLVPVLIFVGHPAVEEVVPYLARRSYLLSTAFGALGLAAFLDHLRQDRTVDASAWIATICLVISVLSNESGYVALPMLPLLAWHERSREPIRAVLARCVLPWLAVLPAIAVRFAVLGWAGGYNRHYVAFARAGKKVLRETHTFNGPEVFASAFYYTWLPVSFPGAESWIESQPIAVALALGFAFWAVVAAPLIDWRDPERRVPGLLFIWMFGYALLYGLSQTWFWRQGYPMVVPLALIIGWLARDAARSLARAPLVGAAQCVPLALLLVGLLGHSPLVNGMDPEPLGGRFDGNEILRDAGELLDGLHGPATVFTVLPVNRASSRSTHAWLARLHGDRDVSFTNLATAPTTEGLARIQGTRLVLGRDAHVPDAARRMYRIEGGIVRLDTIRPIGRSGWLLYPTDAGEWRLMPLDP